MKSADMINPGENTKVDLLKQYNCQKCSDGFFKCNNILEAYHLPYDPEYPMVCMDESSKKMVSEIYKPKRSDA